MVEKPSLEHISTQEDCGSQAACVSVVQWLTYAAGWGSALVVDSINLKEVLSSRHQVLHVCSAALSSRLSLHCLEP